MPGLVELLASSSGTEAFVSVDFIGSSVLKVCSLVGIWTEMRHARAGAAVGVTA